MLKFEIEHLELWSVSLQWTPLIKIGASTLLAEIHKQQNKIKSLCPIFWVHSVSNPLVESGSSLWDCFLNLKGTNTDTNWAKPWKEDIQQQWISLIAKSKGRIPQYRLMETSQRVKGNNFRSLKGGNRDPKHAQPATPNWRTVWFFQFLCSYRSRQYWPCSARKKRMLRH